MEIGRDCEEIIRAEYRRICGLLRMQEMTLDIYVCDEEAPPSQKTPNGTALCNTHPGYSADRQLIALPQFDDLPDDQPEFPPTDWRKFNWQAWRIELWHEVIHQLSDHIGVFNRDEPGRVRDDGSRSMKGHGEGWWTAIQKAAERLAVPPSTLDTVVDR
jgi:hypothetical protein